MKHFNRVLWLMLIAVVSLSLVLSCAAGTATPTAKPAAVPEKKVEEKLPDLISIATFSSGAKWYVIISGMGNAIEKQTGMKVRAIPSGSETAKMKMLLKNEVQFGRIGLPEIYAAYSGSGSWFQEGPNTNLGLIIIGQGPLVLVMRGNSGIKTFADLKGRKVAYYADLDPSWHYTMVAMLAYGGLTYNDVVKYPTTYTPGLKAVQDGAADAALCTPSAPQIYELASSIYGVAYLDFPPENVEGWNKIRQLYPLVRPLKTNIAAGMKEGQYLNTMESLPPLITLADQSENLIYTVVKGIHKGYNDYKDVHPEASVVNFDYTLDKLTMAGIFFPFHPGAVKYFKEAGLWTSWHEKWQQSRFGFKATIDKLYKDTSEQALKTNVELHTKKFDELWEPVWREALIAEMAKKFD